MSKMSKTLVLIMSVIFPLALSVQAASKVTSLDKYKAGDSKKDWPLALLSKLRATSLWMLFKTVLLF